MQLPLHSPTFRALQKEAEFTQQMLSAGATQVRRANYADKGVYFQAFTSLSTGLERIGKLCLMLDYFIDNGRFPDLEYMRREIGHRIVLIHKKTAAIVVKRSMSMKFLAVLSDPVHISVLKVLADFAEGDRYTNINLLVGAARSGDPIAEWFERVDKPLFETCVTEGKKATIARNAHAAKLLEASSAVIHTSETGGMILTMEEASLRSGIQEAVAPYRQLYVLQIVRYWVEVLLALELLAASSDIPYFAEMFAIFYNDDRMFRQRKSWDRL